MSHIVTVSAQVKDLEGLGEACARKNAQLMLGQKTFKAYGRRSCDHAIRLLDAPGSYEVGVVRSGDGTYNMQADLDMPQSRALVERFGQGFETLVNEYQAVVAEAQLRREGWMVQRFEEYVDGRQQIELRAMA